MYRYFCFCYAETRTRIAFREDLECDDMMALTKLEFLVFKLMQKQQQLCGGMQVLLKSNFFI